MFRQIREKMKKKRFGFGPTVAVGLICLMAGLMVAPSTRFAGGSIARAAPGASEPAPTVPSMPASFAAIAERLAPSVVNVKVAKIEQTRGPMAQMPEGPFGDLFERFFQGPGTPLPRPPAQGSGSGVIISSDGYILTNNHVVEGAGEIRVTLSDQTELEAKLIGRDQMTDLAVLKIDAHKDLSAAKMGDSEALRVGDLVLAIGNPFGLSHTVTSGIVSAKGRVIGAGPYDDFIQTDASINPGNSGGPLFNMNGDLVGINTAIVPNGQGIGFAIPVNSAKPLIPQLVSKGEVTRGYIGVTIQPLTPELSGAMNLSGKNGALVADVVPDGPADKAGIRNGDVIVSFDGKNVKESRDLPSLVAATPVGENVKVVVVREGREREFTLKTAELHSGEKTADLKGTSQGKWGLELQDLTPDTARSLGADSDRGVAVVDVKPGSPADKASIRRGDIILEVNRKPVDSVKNLKEKIAQSGDKNSLLLLIRRENSKRFFVLTG